MTNQTLLKVGLVMVVAAIIHVAMFSGLMMVYHPSSQSNRHCEDVCDACLECEDSIPRRRSDSLATDFSAGNTPYPVNTSALNEVKQQILRPRRQPSYRPSYQPSRQPNCPTCVQPSYRPSYQPSRQPNCPTCVQPARQPTSVTPKAPTRVTPQRPTVTPTVTPAVKPQRPASNSPRYEIALFLDDSPKSRVLANWFQHDRNLVTLRGRCDYQEYTANNPMYRTRFANVVPVDQFPAILFLKPDGGHVHAAGSHMIPNNAETLYAGLEEGYRLSRSVDAAQSIPDNSGVIREAGYSWDNQISPNMQLQGSQDCPDGVCPVPENADDRWKPGDRARDLFDRGVPSRNAILWASPIEIAVFVVLGLIVLLAVAAILKKR